MNPIEEYRNNTKILALLLKPRDVYHWLCQHGYFPESYVLPPCFHVKQRPEKLKKFFEISRNGKVFRPLLTECLHIHFPKTEYTDRNFGLIHPEIHNDIAYHISLNWRQVVAAMIPDQSIVSSYTFPIPITKKRSGRVSLLRSGRMIYQFISMTDNHITAEAYKFNYLVNTDIKSFYPSIYTHSIAWALHGKNKIRKKNNSRNYKFLGNKLDKLFQNANDGCTNGIPIGPAVSDIIAEIIASSIDVYFSKLIHSEKIECRAVRFKDDYRILAKTEVDAKKIIKLLQESLKEYQLELNDSKTVINSLPDGLFRGWVSHYHAANPVLLEIYSWKQFRELYLSVVRIESEFPGSGVIDRFLADIINKKGELKISVGEFNLQKVISMLFMLGNLRTKAFPKIISILEIILNSYFGKLYQQQIVNYLEEYLSKLSNEEERNKYLISWISYFLVSNNLEKLLSKKPKYNDPITKSIMNNRSNVFKNCKEHKIFVGCKTMRKKTTMMKHLDIFNPQEIDI